MNSKDKARLVFTMVMIQSYFINERPVISAG